MFSVYVEVGCIILLHIIMLYLFQKLLQFSGKGALVNGIQTLKYKAPLKLVSCALTAVVMPYISHHILIMITPAFKPEVLQLSLGYNFVLWIFAFIALVIGIIRIGLVFDLTPGDVWEEWKDPLNFEKQQWDGSSKFSLYYIFLFFYLSIKLLFKALFGMVEAALVKKSKTALLGI